MTDIAESLAFPFTLQGIYLSTNLPSGAPLPIGSEAQTFDLGTLYWNGATWQSTPINFSAVVVLNVVNFGADPSGVTDSTFAINTAAAAAVTAGGGVVSFPSGRFLVGSHGTFVTQTSGNVLYVGQGRGTIIVNGSANQPAFSFGSSVSSFGGGVASMIFTQSPSVGAVNGNTAITFSQVGQFLVRDVFVSNFLAAPFRGVFFSGSSTGCSQFVVNNLQVQGCLSDGISNIGGVDAYFTDCRSDSNAAAGFVLNASQGGYYKGCTAFNNTGGAWALISGSPSTAPNKNNFFIECVGDTSGTYNWQVGDSQDSSWVSCWGSTQQSITVNTFATGFVFDSQFCKRLTLTNCLTITNNSHGFQLLDTGSSAPTAISLHNCQGTTNGVASGGGYGLTFNGATNQIRVNGGNYSGNVTGSILDQSSASDITISGNPVGFVSANQGSSTIATSATSATVTHGLGFTPNAANIQLTDISSRAASGISSVWISAVSATTFTVSVNTAVTTTAFNFVWRAAFNGS